MELFYEDDGMRERFHGDARVEIVELVELFYEDDGRQRSGDSWRRSYEDDGYGPSATRSCSWNCSAKTTGPLPFQMTLRTSERGPATL